MHAALDVGNSTVLTAGFQDFSVFLSSSMDHKVHMVDIASLRVVYSLKEHTKVSLFFPWCSCLPFFGLDVPPVLGIFTPLSFCRV